MQDSDLSGCRCPPGFKGDGLHCEGDEITCHSPANFLVRIASGCRRQILFLIRSSPLQTSTSAARSWRAPALTAPARTHGVRSTAAAMATT